VLFGRRCCFIVFCIVFRVLNVIFMCVPLISFVIFLLSFPLYVKMAHFVSRCGSIPIFCFCEASQLSLSITRILLDILHRQGVLEEWTERIKCGVPEYTQPCVCLSGKYVECLIQVARSDNLETILAHCLKKGERRFADGRRDADDAGASAP
jgi:hypothetical protein